MIKRTMNKNTCVFIIFCKKKYVSKGSINSLFFYIYIVYTFLGGIFNLSG